MIGDDVEIKVVSMGNDQVRIGIEAPRRIPVHRREVYEAITGITPAEESNSREDSDHKSDAHQSP